MKIVLKRIRYIGRIAILLFLWLSLSITVSKFPGTYFLIVTILFPSVIVLTTIREFYLKERLKRINYISAIFEYLFYWAYVSIIAKFQGPYFLIVSIIALIIIILSTINEFYLKRNR